MLPGLIAFVVIASAHLFGQLTAPGGLLAGITQVLLVPALAWTLLAGTPTPKSRLVRLTLLALVLSWLGDTLPRLTGDDGDVGFVLMLSAFLLAQLAYVAAFLPFAGRSIIRTRPALLMPYALAVGLVIVWCAPSTGALLPVLILYGIAIAVMAVLATGIDAVAATGGVLFLVSDGLIALRAFGGFDLPSDDFWVMLTYCLAQALLVLAVANHDRAAARPPAGGRGGDWGHVPKHPTAAQLRATSDD